nr:hypothetical protein [Halochromatium glycolicum]
MSNHPWSPGGNRLKGEAVQAQGGWIDVDDQAIGVREHQPVGHALEDRLAGVVGLAQGLLGALALSDVEPGQQDQILAAAGNAIA